MALNWTMLNSNRSPVPLPNEMTITTVDAVDLSLTIPDAPPTSSLNSGGSGGSKKLKSTGKVYLTDQRVRALSVWKFGMLDLLDALPCRL